MKTFFKCYLFSTSWGFVCLFVFGQLCTLCILELIISCQILKKKNSVLRNPESRIKKNVDGIDILKGMSMFAFRTEAAQKVEASFKIMCYVKIT